MPPSNPRNRVLATADRLFHQQGFCATGVNQLIAEAGVAKATFYSHFQSKDELAVAYLEGRAQRWLAALDDAATRGTAADRVAAVFDFALRYASEGGVRGCSFVNLAAEFPDPTSPARQSVARFKGEVRARVRSLVAGSPAQGRGDAVFLLLEGALSTSLALDSVWPVEAARDAALALLAT